MMFNDALINTSLESTRQSLQFGEVSRIYMDVEDARDSRELCYNLVEKERKTRLDEV